MLTDSNNPYDILGVDRNADKKTIKQAYAKLVRQYHPEEQPEEWKRVHAAYELAIKNVSGQRNKHTQSIESMAQSQDSTIPYAESEQKEAPSTPIGITEQKEAPSTPIGITEQKEAPNTPIGITEQKEAPNTPIGITEQKEEPNTPIGITEQKEAPNIPIGIMEQKQLPNTPIMTSESKSSIHIPWEIQENDPDDIFGDVEKIANKQREEEEKIAKEKLESAIHEMHVLIWQNKFRKRDWKKFFKQEKLLPVVSKKEFLQELGDCFNLKQIDRRLYTYLCEQLGAIAEYIQEYNSDLTLSKDLAAVQYAEAKVEMAYKRRELALAEKGAIGKYWAQHWIMARWVLRVVLAFIVIFWLRYLGQDQQSQEEQTKRWKEFQEIQQENMEKSMTQQQEMIQNMLDENSDFSEVIRQQIKGLLEEGRITQEEYDSLMQQYGFDQTDSGNEATEE